LLQSISSTSRSEIAAARTFRFQHTPRFNVFTARPLSISIPRLQSAQAVATEPVEPIEPAESGLELQNGFPTFESLRGKIDPALIDAIVSDMGLESMTEVQAKTLDAVLKGVDV
jgi:hypothetical protein